MSKRPISPLDDEYTLRDKRMKPAVGISSMFDDNAIRDPEYVGPLNGPMMNPIGTPRSLPLGPTASLLFQPDPATPPSVQSSAYATSPDASSSSSYTSPSAASLRSAAEMYPETPYDVDPYPPGLYGYTYDTITSIFKTVSESARKMPATISSVSRSITEVGTSARRLGERIPIARVIEMVMGMKEYVKSMGDRAIEEHNLRNQARSKADILAKIESFDAFLKKHKDQRESVILEDVIKMISLELLIEDIMNELLKLDTEIPPLLVRPIAEINSNYEEYFSWEVPVTDIKLDRAYKEFINKQRISDIMSAYFPTRALQITLNEVIDELFNLYNNNFNTLETNFQDKSLNIEGRIEVINNIRSSPENIELTKSNGKPILSAVDYDEIWSTHSKPKATVELEMANIRDVAIASADDTPAASAIRVGQNTRGLTVAAQADASFAPSITRTMAMDAIPIDMTATNNDSIDEDEEFEYPGPPLTGPTGSTPAQKEVSARMQYARGLEEQLHLRKLMQNDPRYQELSKQRGISLDLPPALQKRIQRDKSAKEAAARAITKTPTYGKISELSELEMKQISNAFTEIKNLSAELKDPNSMYSRIADDRKTDTWNSQVHRIFLKLYREMQPIRDARTALLVPKKSSNGGKKSSKNHKKHIKKHTRKIVKRSTRKLQRNHKKHMGHTKKH